MINISLPINSYITCKNLANVASFDIVPTQLVYYSFMKFENHEVPPRFEILGYESRNFLLTSGTLFWCYILYLVLVLAYLIVRKVN